MGFVERIKQFFGLSAQFADGTRVEIVGHGGWPDRTKGTIRVFPSFVKQLASNPPHSADEFTGDGLLRRFELQTGVHLEQWIELDEPTDDGSGDGPYRSTSIDPRYLRRIG